MTKIYEIRNVTSEEVYYPMGLFLDFETAKKELIEVCDTRENVTEYEEEYEELVIVERKTGWNDYQKVMFKICREYIYGDDSSYWKNIECVDCDENK